MRIKYPAQPRIKLDSLLKRRKATLAQWITDVGIHTYDQLACQCRKMGITPPSKEEFDAVAPKDITVATEGIVYVDVEPVSVISEKTEQPIDISPQYEGPLFDEDIGTVDGAGTDAECIRSRSRKNRFKKNDG